MGGRTEGAPGFCWMMKRRLIQQVTLYDKAIIGGGDILFASMVMFNNIGRRMLANGDPGSFRYTDYVEWSTRARKLFGNLKRATYLDIDSFHLWHDDRKYRIYGARHFLLLLEDYHPSEDLAIEEKTGLYQIINENIKKHVETYFWFREQDKTPEHDKLFDIYEFLMLTLKDVGMIKRKIVKGQDFAPTSMRQLQQRQTWESNQKYKKSS